MYSRKNITCYNQVATEIVKSPTWEDNISAHTFSRKFLKPVTDRSFFKVQEFGNKFYSQLNFLELADSVFNSNSTARQT